MAKEMREDADRNEKKRQLVYSAITLTLTPIVLLVALIALQSMTMGWFASNNITAAGDIAASADMKGVTVTLYDEDMALVGDLSAGAVIPFEMDIPGTSALFVIRIQNLSSSTLSVDRVSFPAPANGEEVPLILTENGVQTSYYFSTQLAVKAARISPAGNSPTAVEAAAAVAGNGDGTLLTPGATPGEFVLQNTPVRLGVNASEYLAVKVTFRNFEADQSVYRSFGKNANGQNPAPVCRRRVDVSFS